MTENIEFYKGGVSQKDAREEDIAKDIESCMQIENLSFLMGSGCSSYVVENDEKAIPTMAVLSQKFFQKTPDFCIDEEKLADHYSKNLEEMLDFLNSVKVVNHIREIDRNINEKIRNVQKYIRDSINGGLSCNESLQLYKDFYLKIIRNNRKKPINIFTTNYDLYNEKALDELGFFYNNGFTGSYKRKFNPISYNYTYVEDMNLNKDVWNRIDNFFNLYKLHGSINWVNENSEIIEKNVDQVRDEDLVMIYPTPLKDRTTLMVPYTDILRNMQQILMTRNSVLITLGYSFSDEHINRIIFNALAVSSFRIVIFGESKAISDLKKIKDNRIWIISSNEKIHYFKNIVERLLPKIKDEVQEKQSISIEKKEIEKLISGGFDE